MMFHQEPGQPPKEAIPEESENQTTPKPGGAVHNIVRAVGPLAAIAAGLAAVCSPSGTELPAPAAREVAKRLPAVREETRQALHHIGIFAPELREGAIHCTYNGRAYALTIDERGNMRDLRSGEASAAFQTPITHEYIGSVIITFEKILARHASRQESDRAFSELLGPAPRFTDSDGNRFFLLSGEKKYCVTPLDILEITREPSPEDLANWQEKEDVLGTASQAIRDFTKRHGFDERLTLSDEELRRLPNDALRNEYSALSARWHTAYSAVCPARTQCITTLQHPDYGEVADRPYSVNPRERGKFLRAYKKEEKDIEEWYWDNGISSRTTSLAPRGKLEERFQNWITDEAEECFYDDAWKRHTTWNEKYRPNGTRIFRREGETIRYFGPDNRTVIAQAQCKKNAKGQEYIADVRLTTPDKKGHPIGTYHQHRNSQPDLTPEAYVADVAPALSRDPHLLQRYFHLYWRYTPDRTPDPKKLEDRWKPGNPFWPGEYQQTIHQTLHDRQEGAPVEPDQVTESLFGDCDDLAELAAYILQSQGIRAYNIVVRFEGTDGSRSGHAICFWLEKRPDGRWNAHSQCTGGAMKNGHPLDECPDNHLGYATPQECFRALEEFYGRHGLRVVSCCKDSREGMNLQKIWHVRPTDSGPHQMLTIEDFVPSKDRPDRPLPSPPTPARLKGLLERMGLPGTLVALSSLPVGYLYLRWRRSKKAKKEQRGQEESSAPPEEPSLPLVVGLLEMPRSTERGTLCTDRKGIPWTILEWDTDPPDATIQLPIEMHGALYQRKDQFHFVVEAEQGNAKIHIELLTDINGKKTEKAKKSRGKKGT